MSTPDQILSARIAAVCRRYCGRGRIERQDQAVAELRELAGDRADLLGQHAGVCVGWLQVATPAEGPCFRAEAELCKAAGGDETQILASIEVGRGRAQQARQRLYTG
jgi:hypothetical protein